MDTATATLVHAQLVEGVKSAILQDITAGLVPATVASFSDLHDHVDANGYTDGRVEFYGDADDWLKRINEVASAVDEWLRLPLIQCQGCTVMLRSPAITCETCLREAW